ncbi:rod-binding protein [Roseivivax isoporae]|uniref:Flagellar protein FlgJ n=1 Tax=Roseivivax isoporae LMG 25204 TaxID=1449351 RepID=X7FC77_9RHOB|nr:rod-binding protein [Roseivivax isoporae]ETX29701.1 flagellar protein FlgJ [Roseivivax isoporae LMG 25204]
MQVHAVPPAIARAEAPQKQDSGLWRAAVALERQFLSEMLAAAGLGAPRQAFGGRNGEEQFASFLRDAQAGLLTEAGGIGLARVIHETLKERADAADD